MKTKGQNLIEFLIIIGIISVGAILVLTVLGGNVTGLFSTSNEKVKEYKPFGAGTASNPDSPPMPSGPITVDGVDVNFNPDGSASFNVNGRDITLTSDVMANLNDVFSTSGADGLTDYVMAAIKDIANATDPADGPVEISFGEGTRTDKNNVNYWKGDTSSYNIVAIKAGDKITVIQNDKESSAATGEMGVYQIEGTMTNYDGGTGTYSFVSSGITRLDAPSNPYSTFNYKADVDLSTGIEFSGDIFKNLNNDQGDWNIDFTTSTTSITN